MDGHFHQEARNTFLVPAGAGIRPICTANQYDADAREPGGCPSTPEDAQDTPDVPHETPSPAQGEIAVINARPNTPAQIREANMRLKAAKALKLNESTKPEETIENFPLAALPYLPPLKAGLKGTYKDKINDDDLCMKCLSRTFAILAGFRADWNDEKRTI